MVSTGPVRPRRRRGLDVLRPAHLAAAAALAAASAATGGGPPAAHAAPAVQAPGCAIAGTLHLVGADDHAGIVVRADGGPAATTDAAGAFRLVGVAPGDVTLRAERPRHLSAAAAVVPCREGRETRMGTVALPGGDADGNDRVDLFDLVRVGAHYRQCAGEPDFDPRADLDDSGCVNLFDLVRVTAAYGLTGPRPWPVDGVGEPTPDPEPAPVSFRDDVLPIFDRDCRTCHGYVAGLNLESYAALMAGGNSGPSIVPGDPQASLLYRKSSRQQAPYMPPGGVRLSDADIDTLRRWIEAGARDN